MSATLEARRPNPRDFFEREGLVKIGRSLPRSYMLGYIVCSLGFITIDELAQLGQVLYEDVLSNNPRPIKDVLKVAKLTRESEELRYLRSFLGRLDQVLVETLRSIHGHDFLMSHVALLYDREEMEEQIDLTPQRLREKPRSPAYWSAGEGSARPLILDLYRLEQVGLVKFSKSSTGEEVVLPTNRMTSNLWLRERIHESPLFEGRDVFFVAGRLETRVMERK